MRNPDYLDRSGALHLADRIEKFWRLRGYFGIKCRLVEDPRYVNTKFNVFCVRSNIGPTGYPPKELFGVAA